MSFQQKAESRHLSKALRRHRSNLKSTLTFGYDQSLRTKSVQYFAKGTHAYVVYLSDCIELEPPPRRKVAEDDISAYPTIRAFARARSLGVIDQEMIL
jgi:hypothetical protein